MGWKVEREPQAENTLRKCSNNLGKGLEGKEEGLTQRRGWIQDPRTQPVSQLGVHWGLKVQEAPGGKR